MLKQLILYNLIMLLSFACGSSENNKNKSSASGKVDSAVQDNVDVKPPLPNPGPGLPPGTARITGRLLSITDSTMAVKVTAAEYGSSTPAVATGSVLTIRVPDHSAKESKRLKTGKKIVCLINYRQFLASDNNNSHWVLGEVSPFEGSQ